MNKISNQEQMIRSNALDQARKTALEKGLKADDIIPLAEKFFVFLSKGTGHFVEDPDD